jgi:hypothetical protein
MGALADEMVMQTSLPYARRSQHVLQLQRAILLQVAAAFG